MRSKNLLYIVVAGVILGGVIQREWYSVGLIITLLSTATLLLSKLPERLRGVRRPLTLPSADQVGLLCCAVMVYTLLRGIFAGELSYFLLLLVLSAEYLIDRDTFVRWWWQKKR